MPNVKNVIQVLIINNWHPLLITSLHWLLQEPLDGSARLDISSANFPSLQKILCGAEMVTLKDEVDLMEPRFGNRRGLADSMMLRSFGWCRSSWKNGVLPAPQMRLNYLLWGGVSTFFLGWYSHPICRGVQVHF